MLLWLGPTCLQLISDRVFIRKLGVSIRDKTHDLRDSERGRKIVAEVCQVDEALNRKENASGEKRCLTLTIPTFLAYCVVVCIYTSSAECDVDLTCYFKHVIGSVQK